MYKHRELHILQQNTTYSPHHNSEVYQEDQPKMHYYALYMILKWHRTVNVKCLSSHSISQASSTCSPTHTYLTPSDPTTYHYQSQRGYTPSFKTSKPPSAWMARGMNSTQSKQVYHRDHAYHLSWQPTSHH